MIMALEQKSPQFDPKAPVPEPDSLDGYAAKRDRLASPTRGSRRYLLGLIFAAGLLLGWLVIGWWLWPVQWTNSVPWRLSREHQKTYVSLVAQNYWWTKELQQTRDALAGWDDEALAELLVTMEREASSPEARQQLAALAEALEISTPAESFWTTVLSQKVFLLSSVLSALPLTAAIVLTVSALVQKRTRRTKELLAKEEQFEEALADQMLDRKEMTLGGEQDQAEEAEEEEEEQQAEKKGEEEEDESYEEDEDEFYEEDEEEEEAWVQGLVSGLLDEEDTELSELKALCKRLPHVDTSDLAEHCQNLATQLHRSNSLRD